MDIWCVSSHFDDSLSVWGASMLLTVSCSTGHDSSASELSTDGDWHDVAAVGYRDCR